MSVLLPVTAENELAALGQLPVIAVDMGFSGKTASCGYAFRAAANGAIESENKKFHDCLATVVKQFQNVGEAVLILKRRCPPRLTGWAIRSPAVISNDTPSPVGGAWVQALRCHWRRCTF